MNGRYRGDTPKQGLSLAAGTHQVRLVNSTQNLSYSLKIKEVSGNSCLFLKSTAMDRDHAINSVAVEPGTRVA